MVGLFGCLVFDLPVDGYVVMFAVFYLYDCCGLLWLVFAFMVFAGLLWFGRLFCVWIAVSLPLVGILWLFVEFGLIASGLVVCGFGMGLVWCLIVAAVLVGAVAIDCCQGFLFVVC